MNELFQFSVTTSEEILREINNLDNKRIGSYKNSSINILKESSKKICAYLTKIWNDQVIMRKNFPSE